MNHKKSSQLKSVVEEASSIFKAIEKAWARIGKPAEFSVKVFETEQKNFLGMSTKPAKVGLFFQDQTIDQREQREQTKHERSSRQEPQERHERHERHDKHDRPEKPVRVRPLNKDGQPSSSERRDSERREQRPRQQHQSSPSQQSPSSHPAVQRWSDAMVRDVRTWLEQTLRILGKESVTFSVQPQNYYLKIVFSEPLFADQEKEKTFFRLGAYLIMQSLRTSCKEGFRGFKIIMASTP